MAPLTVATSLSGKQWKERQFCERETLNMAQGLGLPDIVARILASRGIGKETAAHFLEPTLRDGLPDPFHLKDMTQAVHRVAQALQGKQKIVVYGDYDVDGATSSALLYRFFQAVGHPITFYIPDRIAEGYGPNTGAIEKLAADGTHVIITVDCGTTSFEPLARAQELGVDVIVLDHHKGEQQLPAAWAVVNPNRLDEKSPYTYLAAVGLCFLFIVAVNKHLRALGWYKSSSEPDLRQWLDLVALGTVADVMPLTGLNRVYVKQGLKILDQLRNPGLAALATCAGGKAPFRAYHLGFVFGPRVNAGGRVGEAPLGATLLSTHDTFEALKIAQRLQNYNEERKHLEQQALEEAEAMIAQGNLLEKPILIVAHQGWHPGVIGIVAGRLKEKYHRPCFVIAIDEQGIGKGSGRSIAGVDIGRLVMTARQAGVLVNGGGHAMAAGLTVDVTQLKALEDFVVAELAKLTYETQPALDLDGWLSLKAAQPSLYHRLRQIEPFGVENPTPRFGFSHVQIAKADVVGQGHVRCFLSSLDGARLSGIAFRAMETRLGEFLLKHQGHQCHIAGTLSLDVWEGRERLQLFVDDVADVSTCHLSQVA